MDSLAALYPSATGGTGDALSPLSPPAAAEPAAPAGLGQEVPAQVAPETTRPDTPESTWEQLFEEGSDDSDPAAAEIAEPVVAERPDIDKAFTDAEVGKIPAQSVTDFASFARPVEGVEPIPEGLQAMVKIGMSVTEARAVWDASVAAVRNPVQTNMAGAEQVLKAEYGDSYDAKIEAAKGVIAQAERTYPGIRAWLSETGLGNDPTFIRKVVNFAARRGNR